MALPGRREVYKTTVEVSKVHILAASEHNSTFLGLPIEMRNLIYQDILNDIIRPPLHPWDMLPLPKMYLSLLLVNREIKAEVKDLFDTLYSNKLVLYFDDLLRIAEAWSNVQRYPSLRNASFWVRSLQQDIKCAPDAKADGVLGLIDSQPGWKHDWHAHPGWFPKNNTNWADLVGLSRCDPESDGFERWTIAHKNCILSNIDCVPFKKLQFPIMNNKCRVTTYRWRLKGPLDDADIAVGACTPVDSGAMVLEGRLQDVTIRNVPVELVRNRAAC